MYIRRTRPWDFGRPTRPYALNKDCAQAQGLVAWWPMAELNGLVRDWSGNLLSLTNNAATPWKGEHPRSGQSQGLVPNFTAASSQWLSASGVPVSAEPLTLAAWAWINTAANAEILALGVQSGTARHQLIFDVASHIEANSVTAAAASAFAATPTFYTDSAWHHACGVFSASNARAAYLDGTGKGTDTTSEVVSGLNLTSIGARYAGGVLGGFLDGKVSDARVYSRALTDENVNALFDPETRWQLYYPLGRKSWVFVGRAASGSFGGGNAFPALTVA